MEVQLFRCRICGDPYIGTEVPSRCPFCGAPSKYMIDAHNWNRNEFNVELSDISKANLEAALDLEMNNTAFYACASANAKAAGDDYFEAKFKALRKTEAEHAAAICKFLKISVPALGESQCSIDPIENSREGGERETRATASYSKFRDEAVEPRLKEFFNALVEIESDHMDMHAAAG